MVNLHNGLKPEEAFLEYSLEILHNCLTPHGFKDAQASFGKLEDMLKEEKSEQVYFDKVNKAKSILNEMKEKFSLETNVFLEDYTKPLEKMRNILLDAQEKFSRKYI